MSDVYRLIHPVKYFNDYITRETRPDGRSFQDQRNMKLNVDSLKTAEASAVVKCGNTTVVCGIKMELAVPKAEDPEKGFLITNVELPALCSPKSRPGPPSEQAQITSNIVSDIIINSNCIDLKNLCIVPDKLVWVLYCDMICLDNDGSLVDACLIALMASLKSLSLPTVTYDTETEEIQVDTLAQTPLKVNGLPVATSFAIYQYNSSNIILTDPSAYEEDMCGGIGANLIICHNNSQPCGIQKFGGGNITTEKLEEAIKIANIRSDVVEKAINSCLDSN